MIISYDHNFAFIRIPKSGSTSTATMIHDMGILNKEIDICNRIEDASFGEEGDRHNGLKKSDSTERDGFNISYNYKLIDQELLGEAYSKLKNIKYTTFFMHTTWNMLLQNGLVEAEMECISTIRHPVDRFISICYFFDAGAKTRWPETYINNLLEKEGINGICDRLMSGERVFQGLNEMLTAPQSYYLNDNPTLWNIENIYDWIEEFAKIKGGNIQDYYWAKKQIRPRAFLDNKVITESRQKYLMDRYEKDLLLWENSYKRFN